MKKKLTTSVAKIATLFELIEEHGMNRNDFLIENGLDPAVLDSPDNRVTLQEVQRLTEKAVSNTGDSHFGLHQGEKFTGFSNILSYVMLNCKNLNEAVAKMILYQRICDEGTEIRLERSKHKAKIIVSIQHSSIAKDVQLTNYRLSAIYTYLKKLTVTDFPLDKVLFQHAQPEKIPEYRRIFKCRTIFDSPENALIFDDQHLDLTIPENNSDLLKVMETHAIKTLKNLDIENIYEQKVGRIISNFLPGTTPTIEEVAAEMGMSVRNLQLKLKYEKTTFSKLLHSIRKDLALNYLEDNRMSIAEIAYLLGYSEVSVFHRAFKKWTNKTPRQYRLVDAYRSDHKWLPCR